MSARDEELRALLSRSKTSFLSNFTKRSVRPAVPVPVPMPAPAPAPALAPAPVTMAVPMELASSNYSDPMEWMKASVQSGTSGTSTASRIERKEKNFEARPVATEHRLKVAANQARAVQAWAQHPRPPAPLPPPPPPLPAAPDVPMEPVIERKEPRIGERRLVLSDCLDSGAKSRCFHEVSVETYKGKGEVDRVSHGNLAGCYIASLCEVLDLSIPEQWTAHLSEQSRANVDRLQQPYRKAERKTRPGSKRKKPSGSAQTDGGSGVSAVTKGGSANVFGKASIKPQKRKFRTGIGGRRSGTSTSKHRMKTFVRVVDQFPLTTRNSVHKGTTVPIDDMFELRDRGVGAYHPLTFPAVQFRTPDPHGTVSLMESGELSVSSAPSEDEALILAMQQVILTTLQFGKPAILENFGAANITASAGLGWAIDLDKLALFIETHPMHKTITYDRTMFPGLHWTLKEPLGVVLGFFELGFVNAVGLKEERHFKFVRDSILPDVVANRHKLENKQKTNNAVPMEKDKKEFEELLSHVDKSMADMNIRSDQVTE